MIKSCVAQVKAAGPTDGLEEGQFVAYASVFDNVDSYGDVVRKGAFADSLTEWKDSGDPIPVYWSHLMSADPEMNLGHVLEASEDDHGLKVRVQLDLENPKAVQVYRLLKGRRVRQMSFAYDIVDAGPAKIDGRDVLELRALKVHEVSVVPIGANQETDVLAVKAATTAVLTAAADLSARPDGGKAGRVLSAPNLNAIKSAITALQGVVDSAGSADEDDEEPKANGTGSAKDEGGSSVKSAAPPQVTPSADSWSAQLALLSSLPTE